MKDSKSLTSYALEGKRRASGGQALVSACRPDPAQGEVATRRQRDSTALRISGKAGAARSTAESSKGRGAAAAGGGSSRGRQQGGHLLIAEAKKPPNGATSDANTPEGHATRGDYGHLMIEECIASQSEVIRAIVSGYSPCCGVPAPRMIPYTWTGRIRTAAHTADRGQFVRSEPDQGSRARQERAGPTEQLGRGEEGRAGAKRSRTGGVRWIEPIRSCQSLVLHEVFGGPSARCTKSRFSMCCSFSCRAHDRVGSACALAPSIRR